MMDTSPMEEKPVGKSNLSELQGQSNQSQLQLVEGKQVYDESLKKNEKIRIKQILMEERIRRLTPVVDSLVKEIQESKSMTEILTKTVNKYRPLLEARDKVYETYQQQIDETLKWYQQENETLQKTKQEILQIQSENDDDPIDKSNLEITKKIEQLDFEFEQMQISHKENSNILENLIANNSEGDNQDEEFKTKCEHYNILEGQLTSEFNDENIKLDIEFHSYEEEEKILLGNLVEDSEKELLLDTVRKNSKIAIEIESKRLELSSKEQILKMYENDLNPDLNTLIRHIQLRKEHLEAQHHIEEEKSLKLIKEKQVLEMQMNQIESENKTKQTYLANEQKAKQKSNESEDDILLQLQSEIITVQNKIRTKYKLINETNEKITEITHHALKTLSEYHTKRAEAIKMHDSRMSELNSKLDALTGQTDDVQVSIVTIDNDTRRLKTKLEQLQMRHTELTMASVKTDDSIKDLKHRIQLGKNKVRLAEDRLTQSRRTGNNSDGTTNMENMNSERSSSHNEMLMNSTFLSQHSEDTTQPKAKVRKVIKKK